VKNFGSSNDQKQMLNLIIRQLIRRKKNNPFQLSKLITYRKKKNLLNTLNFLGWEGEGQNIRE
jgi:hypothetical protein